MVLVCETDAGPHNENRYKDCCSTEEMKAELPDLKLSLPIITVLHLVQLWLDDTQTYFKSPNLM